MLSLLSVLSVLSLLSVLSVLSVLLEAHFCPESFGVSSSRDGELLAVVTPSERRLLLWKSVSG